MFDGVRSPDQIAIVAGLVLEARIGRLNENVGLEAGTAKHALDAEHFVADGIAIAERCKHLVDFRFLSIQHRSEWQLGQDVGGGPQDLSAALANQPGSGSCPGAMAPARRLPSAAPSMSRYFCSMTGQA